MGETGRTLDFFFCVECTGSFVGVDQVRDRDGSAPFFSRLLLLTGLWRVSDSVKGKWFSAAAGMESPALPVLLISHGFVCASIRRFCRWKSVHEGCQFRPHRRVDASICRLKLNVELADETKRETSRWSDVFQ